MRPAKYRNKKTKVDGIVFDSKKEAMHYCKLKVMLRAGLISDLELQVPYVLEVNGVKICKYVADFVYFDKKLNKTIVDDCKGFKTREYILKKKLMAAIHGIKITES